VDGEDLAEVLMCDDGGWHQSEQQRDTDGHGTPADAPPPEIAHGPDYTSPGAAKVNADERSQRVAGRGGSTGMKRVE
jgi:hypothetical protein